MIVSKFVSTDGRKSLGAIACARKSRINSARVTRIPSLRILESDADIEIDRDRTDVSLSLSVRYIQLRERVSRDRSLLRSLRDEHLVRMDLLDRLRATSYRQRESFDRLRQLNRVLMSVRDFIDNNPTRETSIMFEGIKRELSAITPWNNHIASFLNFLESREGPMIKDERTRTSDSHVRKSPLRHWTP